MGKGGVTFRDEPDDFVYLRIHVDADRITAVLDYADLIPQQLAEHDDAPVGFAEVLVGAVGYGALGFPGHVVLAGEISQMKLSGFVSRAHELHRRVLGLSRYAAVFGRTETQVVDLGARVVDGRTKMHGITGPDGDEEKVREDERVGRFDRETVLAGYLEAYRDALGT